MTDRKSALQDLLAKVEAGESGWNRLATIAEDALPPREAALTATAYNGSLDAAMALHDAVLPGWAWWRTDRGRFCVGIGFAEFGAINKIPSRAWLIAIIRALHGDRE